jgi:hypothetical protein
MMVEVDVAKVVVDGAVDVVVVVSVDFGRVEVDGDVVCSEEPAAASLKYRSKSWLWGCSSSDLGTIFLLLLLLGG